MIRLIIPAGLALVATGQTLSTDYSKKPSLRIESVTTFKMEQTSFEMEIDGESRDRPGAGGQSSEETRTIVQVDTVLEEEGGKPTKVRRAFEEMNASSSRTFGEDSRDSERDGSLNEVTLEITVEDGEAAAKVTEGSAPDDEAALEGHVPTLALDALLPHEEVDVDDSWDIESDDVLHALGLDLSKAFFPRVQREEGGGGGGRGGGRGGFRGGRGGGSPADMFAEGEWEGEATLASASEEHDGVPCVVIKVKLESSGDLPEPELGGGGRRGRMPFSVSDPVAPLASTYEIEIEGRLFFSVQKGRPVYLELEGTMSTERNTERDFGDRHMSMSSTEEGTFTQTVTVTEAKSE